ncbi:MAG: glycosyltransferase family 4 protein [Verrucomicrobia bacterium]|nr:glycosyltransferase family 4 protein [Verrucomicrobiota bacterium]
MLIARLFRRRVLIFWRGWENSWCGGPEFPGGNGGWLSRVYRQAAAHVVLSARFRDDLRRWGFRDPIYVETTVVTDECLSQEPPPHAGNPENTNLLFLSRIEVAKGVFELLDVYRILKDRNPAYTLTVAGDGPALESLKDRVGELGLRDVSFPGYLQGQEKFNCYRQGSIFCFLSYTEGMPNAVLEAMALGLPLVSSDAGGLRDILVKGRTGFVVRMQADAPPKAKFDPVQVADLIDRLARDRDLYQRVSGHNAAYARARFAAATVAKRLEAIYAAAIGNSTTSCTRSVEVY